MSDPLRSATERRFHLVVVKAGCIEHHEAGAFGGLLSVLLECKPGQYAVFFGSYYPSVCDLAPLCGVGGPGDLERLVEFVGWEKARAAAAPAAAAGGATAAGTAQPAAAPVADAAAPGDRQPTPQGSAAQADPSAGCEAAGQNVADDSRPGAGGATGTAQAEGAQAAPASPPPEAPGTEGAAAQEGERDG